MLFRLTFLTAALFATAAHADEAPNLKEQASLQGYADKHPACVEWTDGCAVCQRGMAVYCSTPGIACQPTEIACKAP